MSGSNRLVVITGVVGAIRGDRPNLLIGWHLFEQFGQHGRIADVTVGDLDSPDLQCFRINPEVDLTLDAPLRAAMLARVPLAFALRLDAGAVDEKVQRSRRAAIRQPHVQRLLTAAQCAEIRHRSVQTDQTQETFHEPGRLPQRKTK